jgi:hypothetical protein
MTFNEVVQGFINPGTPLLKEAFHLSKILDKEGLYSWFTYANNIVSEISFDIDIPYHYHFVLRIYTSIFYCFHLTLLFI